jgi:hypothetical protein
VEKVSRSGLVGYSRIAKNAKLGDGCIIKQQEKGNASLSFMSTDLKLLEIKKLMCVVEGIEFRELRAKKSGYGGKKPIYGFDSRVNAKITKVSSATTSELIESIDKLDLFLWYMDDGSWHKTRNTMHLYSNMLDDDETDVLIEAIGSLYGILPRTRKDRKKDGRSFNYLYFPRELVKRFRPEFKEFAIDFGIDTMYYKFGGLEYEEAN